MPTFSLTEVAESFVQTCCNDGWVLERFDWPKWVGTAEATALHANPELLAQASSDQLAKLLTALIRGERFCDGSLNVAYESGLLLAICRRAQKLSSALSITIGEGQDAAFQGDSVLYLISCVGQKQSAAAPAKDLYISTWFQKARQYVEQAHAPWFILSAEHGLVGPNDTLSPYNRTLNQMGVAERRAWAQKVRRQMDDRLPDVARIIIFAGQKYRENLSDYLRLRAANVEIPLEGLRIGQQLAWFSNAERK